MSSPSGITLREMTVDDIPAGLALCRASRWNQTERDWRFFLESDPHGALVAEDEGAVIGSVATLPYGPFAWISMVLVDPSARHRGIGTTLLDRGLALVPDSVVARLDATPAGEPLYRKRGFVAEYGLARLSRDPGAPEGPKDAKVTKGSMGQPGIPITRPLAASDWDRIRQLDLRAFGASRAALLERLAVDAPEYAWVGQRDGQIAGYLLGRHGHVREHLGPLVADAVDTAQALLDTCLDAHAERAFFIDAPDDQRAWRDWLAGRGFVIERPFLRMHRGPLTARGEPARIYATTGPEFG